jgi:Uma2 family endonuclease
MITALQRPTLQEFLQRADIDGSPRLELLESGVQQKPMGTLGHSRIQKRLTALIDAASDRFEALPELRSNLDPQSVVPDISVYAVERLPESGHSAGAPDFVIEIRSPGQSIAELTDKILYCCKHGTRLGWLIDPQRDRIMVWQDGELDILTGSDQLPTLELLSITVADVFRLQS